MRASRQSAQNHWRSVGRRARTIGLQIEAVLTSNESINALIREGYEQGRRDPSRPITTVERTTT